MEKNFNLRFNQPRVDSIRPHNQENFKNKGITSLGNLIQNTTKTINFKNKLGNGKMFKEPVNFKVYKIINNINVV